MEEIEVKPKEKVTLPLSVLYFLLFLDENSKLANCHFMHNDCPVVGKLSYLGTDYSLNKYVTTHVPYIKTEYRAFVSLEFPCASLVLSGTL